MNFKDFKFQKDGKPRRWEELTEEEKKCLCEQVYEQQKEEFERNWGFDKKNGNK